jgi:signal transduction histidine kinase/AmiR/NasT family two-component response regulator
VKPFWRRSPLAGAWALPRRLSAVFWIAVLLFLLAQAAAALWLIEGSRTEASNQVQQHLVRYSESAEAAVNRTLLSVDLALAGVSELLHPAFNAAGRVNEAEAERLLSALNDRNLSISHLLVLDGLRQPVAASSRQALALADRLPLALFEQSLSASPAQLRIGLPEGPSGRPALGLNGEPALLMARAAALQDGRAVVVLAEVPAAVLEQVITPGADTSDKTATLEDEFGRLLLAVPRQNALLGRVRTGLDQAAPGQILRGEHRLSGEPALWVLRNSSYRSVHVTASIAEARVLTRGARERQVLAVGAALFMLCTAAAAALFYSQLVRMARARGNLLQSQRMLDQALGSMGDGFLLCDREDRVVLWNDRYVELFPWLRGRLRRGMPFVELAEMSAAQVKAQGTPADRQAWVQWRMDQHRGGDHTWGHAQGLSTPVHTVERRMPDGGMVGVYRDVAESERRLAEAKIAAEAANAAKSRFLAAMSHELRTPLNAVLGMNGLLLGTPLNAEQRRHTELMRQSGQMLLAVINDILDVSMIEAGRMTLESLPFDPRATLQEAVVLLQVRAQAKQLALDFEAAEPLPAALVGDASRLRQVLFNLVGNALKFTEQGGVTVRAGGREQAGGRFELTVTVSDTGIGIPAEVLPRLFERFTQGDSTTARRYGGSGLGLAISREIIELMGGRIAARNRPAGGSEFSFTLSLARASFATPGGAWAKARWPAPAAQPARHWRVLVAEDNAVNQILVRALLERMGHCCDVVADGSEALLQLQSARYDVVLMDVQMPGMDGLEATRRLRQRERTEGLPRLPVLAMTAHAMAEDRQTCLEAGMDDHVTKPVEPEVLAAAIDHAVLASRSLSADAAGTAADPVAPSTT